jgi:hypothetical protein
MPDLKRIGLRMERNIGIGINMQQRLIMTPKIHKELKKASPLWALFEKPKMEIKK